MTAAAAVLPRSHAQVVELLRDARHALTYDRIAYRLGYEPESVRNVSSICRSLVEQGYLEEDGRSRSLLGRTATGYRVSKTYEDAGSIALQGSLFADSSYAATTRQQIRDLIMSVGKGNASIADVSIDIVDRLTVLAVPETHFLDDGEREATDVATLDAPRSNRSENTLRSPKRREVYQAVIEGQRETPRGLTRTQLRRRTGFLASTLLPRVTELIEESYCCEGAAYNDPTTGRKRIPILAVPPFERVSIHRSDFYNERLAITTTIETSMERRIGEVDHVFDVANRLCEDFVLKYADPQPLTRDRASSVDNFRIILIGPPACGKGTQARNLVAKYGLRHVVPGDVFRQHVTEPTDIGREVQATMDTGLLVGDDLVNRITLGRISEITGGYVLDGYPRTLEQVVALERHLERSGGAISHVLSFEIDEDVVHERVRSRLVDPRTGQTYSENEILGTAHAENTLLVRRPEDGDEAFQRRLQAFQEQTLAVVSYYRTHHPHFHGIDASASPEAVGTEIDRILSTYEP